MRYRQVEAFRHVMIQGTTTGAAQTMGITQPAVSRLIADLEAGLEFLLFDRHKGRLLPTGDAMRLYRGVDMFYSGLDQLERLAEQIRTEQPGDIRVSATPALSTFVFPEAITLFKELYPAVQIMATSSSSAEITNQLNTNLTDIAITHSFPDVTGIVQETLIEAPHVCAIHHSNPLTSKEVITPEDLIGAEVLTILPSGFANWNSVAQVLEEANIDYKKGVGVQNSHTGYSLVAANLATALIEPFASRTWVNNGVVIRPFLPPVAFEYVLAYPLTLQQSEPLKTFAKVIRQVFLRYGKETMIHS